MNIIEDNFDISSIESIKVLHNKKSKADNIKPEGYRIQDILELVDDGSWALPDFQRDFNWNDDKIKDLLDSILRGYFIGTFLILSVDNKDKLDFGIRAVEGTNTNLNNVKGLILDGQQRITSLYKAIKEPNKPSNKKISSYFYIDLKALFASSKNGALSDIVVKNSEMFTDKKAYAKLYFPFYKMENYPEWIDGFWQYLEEQGEKYSDYITVVRSIEDALKDFWTTSIPIIKLPSNIDLDSLSNIFERVNTKGLELNNFDLLVARLSKYKIKLRELWNKNIAKIEKSAESIFNKNFIKTNLPLLMVQGISLYYTNEANRKAILNLYDSVYRDKTDPQKNFETDFNVFTDELKKAIDKMHDDYYARLGLVPFNATLPVLTTLLKRRDDLKNVSKEELDKKIDMWYWSAVLTGTYSKSSESQMKTDIKQVVKWFHDNNAVPETVAHARNYWGSNTAIQALEDDVTYDKRQESTFKAILSLIGSRGARDFISGSDYRGRISKDNIDHIFPQSIFEKDKHVHSILNLTLLKKSTNEYKTNKVPSEYIKEYISNYYQDSENAFKEVLSSHVINNEAYEAMKKDELETFLEARGKDILEEIRRRIGAKP